MGKTKYARAKELLTKIKEKNGDTVPFSLLRNEVLINIGADEIRTVRPYVKLMVDLKLIEQTGGGSYVVIRL